MIRRARPADVPALHALELASFSTDRLSPRSFRHHLNNPAARLLVAEVDGQLAGYLLMLYRRNSLTGRLYSVAISAPYRGRSLGSALLQAAEVDARARGKQRIRLEVHVANHTAQQIYTRHGYTAFGTRDNYYQDLADALRMEKPLAQPAGSVEKPGRRASATTTRSRTMSKR